MPKHSQIFQTLEMLGLTSQQTREVFSERTRDRSPLTVWRDRQSGVIYIDDHYIGDEDYETGSFETGGFQLEDQANYENIRDFERRFQRFRPLITEKDICDFGCGAGRFLIAAQEICNSVNGVELLQAHQKNLRSSRIECFETLNEIDAVSLDIVTAFHSLEHLPDPIHHLNLMHERLRPGGLLIVEVPHADDLLLRADLECAAFRDFTLWSQHLVLHTRDSLTRLLTHCGFKNVIIEGVQRYPLSNHLHWLSKGRPGGHKGNLSALDTAALSEAYGAALAGINATDTLIAIAEKP